MDRLKGEKTPETTSSYRQTNKKTMENKKEYKFRIMTTINSGRSIFVDEDGKTKPMRTTRKEDTRTIPDNANVHNVYGQSNWSYFWVCGAYSYDTESMVVLVIDKVDILKNIENYAHDEEYGNPLGYDIKLMRTDDGEKSKYSLKVSPPKKVSKEIEQEAKKYNFDFDAYMRSEKNVMQEKSDADMIFEDEDGQDLPF